MKISANYIVDDSWTQTIDQLPELNRNLTGIYFNWIKQDNNHIQEIVFIDVIYMNTICEKNPRFYRLEFNSESGADKEYIKTPNPYAWKYKD